MDAGLFIFLGTQAIIFILRCLTAKIFILKNCQPSPLPPESTVRPLKKGTKFNHSQIVPTAMLHGLWPSIMKGKAMPSATLRCRPWSSCRILLVSAAICSAVILRTIVFNCMKAAGASFAAVVSVAKTPGTGSIVGLVKSTTKSLE